jgi:hypothetical protein
MGNYYREKLLRVARVQQMFLRNIGSYVTSQMTAFFIVIAVKTLNLT